MLSSYLIYFYNLTKEQQIKQILMTIVFFLILFAFCGLLIFLKFKFLDKTKNTLFQRFLNRF